MAEPDGIAGVDLTAENYRVEHGLVSNEYCIYDGDGELLLRADERSFSRRGKLPFRDGDGEEVFRLEPGNVEDDYFVVPADSDRPRVIVEEDFSFLQHRWNVRRGRDERLVATIEAAGPSVEFFRYYVPMMGVLPHTYTIADADGEKMGTLARRFSLTDKYVLDVGANGDIASDVLVTAAISVDVLDSR